MVVQTAELVFNDTKSRHNQDLTEFLERNLQSIITRGQVKFRFKIAKRSDLAGLRSRGIARLPAMILQGMPFTSVPAIIEELRKRVKNSKSVATPKSEVEVLDDYYRRELGNIQTDEDGKHIIPDDDNDIDDTPDFASLAANQMKRRRGEDVDEQPKRASRAPPQKVDRMFSVQDDDYEDRRQPPIINPMRNEPRMDNITEEPGDPLTVLNNMKAQGANAADDDMMRSLLGKMGGEAGYDI
jgi:hypothetical protein